MENHLVPLEKGVKFSFVVNLIFNQNITHMTIFFLNKGQSKVKVSYSPPSPQTFEPYLSF